MNLRSSLFLFLALVLLPGVVRAQGQKHGTSTAAAHSIFDMPEPMFGEMPLVAPLFLQTDQIDSSITVVNATNMAVQGTVTLRDQSGAVIGSQAIYFPTHSNTPVAMKSILARVGSLAHSGSVTITQDPNVKGPALLAQLSMSMHSGSQGAFLEEEFGMPTAHGSSVLQGVASQTRNLPLIAITSVSDVAQTIQANCIGENKSTTLELPARGTAVLQACSWQAIVDASLSLTSTLTSSNEGSEADHAISLRSDGVSGSFYAFGLALNGDLSLAQLQPLDFYDPGTSPSSGIVYVGVPTGTSSLLSEALSAPVVTLANFANQPRQTSITWSDSSSGSPKVQSVANITLAPFSTLTSTLSAVKGTGVLNTFIITSDGRPGDVQAHLFTSMGSSQQRTELLAKDAKDDHNGGDHPWSTANGDRSTLLIYNSTSQDNQFFVRISGSGSTWEQTYILAPHETRAISINDIIAKQQPDHKKMMVNPMLTEGEVQWATELGGTGIGRLLVTNSSRSLARNFSCTIYYNLCAASFGAENYEDVFLSGSPVDLSQIVVTFCTEYSPTACGQNTTVSSYQAYTTHWSNSSGVSQSAAANTDLAVKAVSLGQYSVTAYETAGSCQTSPTGGGGNVRQPNNLYVADDDTATAGCGGSAPNAQLRIITYTVQSDNTPITGSVNLIEGVPNPTKDSCGRSVTTGANGFNTAQVSPKNGYQFADLLQACGASAQQACSFSFPNQQWLLQNNGGTVATIGAVSATASTVSVRGNTTTWKGTDFKP